MPPEAGADVADADPEVVEDAISLAEVIAADGETPAADVAADALGDAEGVLAEGAELQAAATARLSTDSAPTATRPRAEIDGGVDDRVTGAPRGRDEGGAPPGTTARTVTAAGPAQR